MHVHKELIYKRLHEALFSAIILWSMPIFAAHKRIRAKRIARVAQEFLHITPYAPFNGNGISFFKELIKKNSGVFKTYAMHVDDEKRMLHESNFIKKLVTPTEYEPFSFSIRVLLDEQLCQGQAWIIKTGSYFLQYVEKDMHHELKSETLSIRLAKDQLYANGVPVGKQLIVRPATGYLQFDGYEYPGAMIIMHTPEKAYLINHVDIEDYVFCVLRWEGWPGWPLEVNKVFAVSCRTYVIYRVLEAHKRGRPYHIKNSNLHQTYNGIHGYDVLRKAIEETRGMIITHNKKPIEAMFDSCCGGVIPAKMAGITQERTPYLYRTKPCHFCESSKIYAWKFNISVHDFRLLLRNAGHKVHEIRDIKITRTDKAGCVQQVVVTDRANKIVLTGKQMYALMSKVKSFNYTINKKGRDIAFSGKGYGHHLGLCQWGARKMVDKGWLYNTILAFYYPNTTLMELRKAVKGNAKL